MFDSYTGTCNTANKTCGKLVFRFHKTMVVITFIAKTIHKLNVSKSL